MTVSVGEFVVPERWFATNRTGLGLTREWFTVLSKEMFNPNYALFVPSAEGMTYQPNCLSAINPEHLNYFKFVGRVVGMAVCPWTVESICERKKAWVWIWTFCVSKVDSTILTLV